MRREPGANPWTIRYSTNLRLGSTRELWGANTTYRIRHLLCYFIKSNPLFLFFLQEYDKTLYLSCISLMAGSTKKTAPISLTSLALSSRPAVFWWLNWTSLDGWDNFSGLKTAEPSLAPCQWNRATILTCSGSETDLTRHGGKAQARRRKPHNEVLSN